MPNVTTSQVLSNGERNAVVRLTFLGDGSGQESGIIKINAGKTGPFGSPQGGKIFYPNLKFRIEKIWYDIKGLTLRVQWEGMPNIDALILGNVDDYDFKPFGGIPMDPTVSFPTGNIAFTTVGAVAGSSYTVLLWLIKDIQS